MSGRPWRALVPIAVVLIGLPWAFKLLDTHEVGAPCGPFDCAPITGRCVQGEHGEFCTKVCTDDGECPESGHCGVPPHDFHWVQYSASPLSETVCVPGPRPARPPSVDDFPQPNQPNQSNRSPQRRGH